MESPIDKLISLGSPDLLEEGSPCPKSWQGLKRELYAVLLSRRNGFYAFESALLVRPLGESSAPRSVESWNSPDLWKNSYEIHVPELYFFAEDIFGGQFALTDEEVVSFDPETGEVETISNSIEGWIQALLKDWDYFTGYSLASTWQRMNGRLPVGFRLVPKQLFVLGGEFKAENLVCVEDVRGMRSRGFFATQLGNVPDGTKIAFEFID